MFRKLVFSFIMAVIMTPVLAQGAGAPSYTTTRTDTVSLFSEIYFHFDKFDLDKDYHVELDRAFSNKYKLDINYSTVYVDYDDCLILEKRYVNVELVQFLYQCLNKGKRLVLLSKHEGDLDLELKQFRLEGLFDEVIHISRDEQKCEYVIAKDSIFIDDSHAERKNIMKTRHIPVFAPDMINVLLRKMKWK